MTDQIDFDVAIVGYGPVGQALAAMLGQAGYRVGVFERWAGLYPLPRACVVDHEIMRVLQSVGVAEAFSELAVPTNGEYLWLNAEGKTLYHFKYPKQGISGWPARNLIYQPDLEALLHAKVQSLASVELNQGWGATTYLDGPDYATLGVQPGHRDAAGTWVAQLPLREVRARYVVGADGANSFVRGAAGMDWTDLGFRSDWLVVDYKPHDPEKVLDMPEAGQICDPARPITLMRHMGRKHVRWEMMLLPGESAADITEPTKVWSMIDRWVKPGDGEIVRAAVYRFQSGVADSWVRGRALLIGDAAHLMPPFLGQGLCSGLRDAKAAFWRLDLILRGVAEPTLLRSYEEERKSHVSTVIARAVALGKVVCITDPEEAAKRDEAILAGSAPPIPAFPGLTTGILNRSLNGKYTAVVGQLSLQARIKIDGQVGLLDDLVGPNWTILQVADSADVQYSAAQRHVLDTLGVKVVTLNNSVDPAGQFQAYFENLGVQALVVRPDFYIFAAASSLNELPGLIDDLEQQLGMDRQRSLVNND
jgi:2-polyprenyl-6-methoxyphenol hydroxylase-like FAD-dependent oxidoreductase